MRQKKRSLQRGLSSVVWGLLVGIPVWAATLAVAAKPNVFVSDFDKGFSKWQKELCCDHSAEIVNSPTRAGKQAIRFTLKRGDPFVANNQRAELKLEKVPPNSEKWYGLSVLVPEDFKKDRTYEIITQWHSRPNLDAGEKWRTPPLAILIRNNRLFLHRRWDPNPITRNNKPGPGGGRETLPLGDYNPGEWTDFVVHVKWSHTADGSLKVWQNGKLVVNKSGPNTYNDPTGPYLKIGLYKPSWKSNPKESQTTKRIIYFDEVRIGDATASYQDVKPGDRSISPRFLRELASHFQPWRFIN